MVGESACKFLTTLSHGMLVLSLVFAGSVDGATAHFLHKRDAPLATVNIPLTVNKDQRYVVGVNMSSSPNTQRFKFALAANTGYNAVAGTACDSCDGVPTYNASASSSQESLPGSKKVTVGSASINGHLIKENCGLQEVNGSAWQYPKQTIIVANSSSSLFSEVTSGLIGLGTNANGVAGDFLDTIFGGWLSRNPTRDNFTFGMALEPPIYTSDDDEGNGGILHWVVPDPSAYEGAIVWNTANVSSAVEDAPTGDAVSGTTANSGLELPESDWIIELDSWAASISGTTVSNASKAQAVIEPFFPDIYFPRSQANMLYTAIFNAVELNSLVDGAQAWSIPCDTTLTVVMTFSGQSFTVDQSQLVVKQSDGTCVGAIKAWPDSAVNNFLLGSNFISAFYLIFVIGRPGLGIPNSIGMASRASSHSSKPVGAIVGGTVGGFFFVAILLAAAFALGRRSRAKRVAAGPNASSQKNAEKERFYSDNGEGSDEDSAQYAVRPLTLFTKSNRTQIPTPLSTARSATSSHPLLPEVQSPHSPALSTPNTPMNFLSTSPGPSYRGHSGEGGSSSGRISYNPAAFGSNVAAAHAASPYVVPYTDVQDYRIEPFVVPAVPVSSSASGHLGISQDPQIHLWQPQQDQQRRDVPSSRRDIDPLLSLTASRGGTVVPFILPPPPRGALARQYIKVGAPLTSTPRQADDAPAPPYTDSGEVSLIPPLSPTLVE